MLAPLAGGVATAVYAVVLEEHRLSSAASRLRELAEEGLDELRAFDTVPEFAYRAGRLALPDGREVDRARLLRRELADLRIRENRGGVYAYPTRSVS